MVAGLWFPLVHRSQCRIVMQTHSMFDVIVSLALGYSASRKWVTTQKGPRTAPASRNISLRLFPHIPAPSMQNKKSLIRLCVTLRMLLSAFALPRLVLALPIPCGLFRTNWCGKDSLWLHLLSWHHSLLAKIKGYSDFMVEYPFSFVCCYNIAT